MAKEKSLIEIQGTLMGVTHVNSKAYGKHVRAKRGTYTEIEVNDAFKKSSKEQEKTNRVGKMIKDALEPYREGLKRGSFWYRLLSELRAQYKAHRAFDFTRFRDFEIHEDYPLDRLVAFGRVLAEPDRVKRILRVKLEYHQPTFRQPEELIDGYRLTVIAIYPDLKKIKATTEFSSSPIIPLREESGRKSLNRVKKPATEQSYELPLPRNAKEVLLCVKMEGAEGDEVRPIASSMGMSILLGRKV